MPQLGQLIFPQFCGHSAMTAGEASAVGPVTRQSLTRADDFFGGPDSLTLCDKLVRGQVPE
jgi:hypothetical protein